jgi:dihydrofolate reductase
MTTRVIADITVSLDGYVTAPNAGPESGLGDGGDRLHNWVFQGDDVDKAVLAEATGESGAVIMGRTLFDIVDAPNGWNDQMGYGAQHAAQPPFFVVTHRGAPAIQRLDLDFTFVDKPSTAVELARAAAGDRNVIVMGGGSLIRQCVLAGLVDELRLHISPIVFGGGTELFSDGDRVELSQVDARPSSTAVHVTYRVTR